MREEPSLSGILESLGRHATMVLKLQGSCKLAAMALCDLQIFEIAIQDLVLASVVLKDKQ